MCDGPSAAVDPGIEAITDNARARAARRRDRPDDPGRHQSPHVLGLEAVLACRLGDAQGARALAARTIAAIALRGGGGGEHLRAPSHGRTVSVTQLTYKTSG